MGLLANNPQLMQQAQTVSAPSIQARLAEEEASMRAQVAQQQQQMPQNSADFLAVCHRLGSYGFGMPSLAGNAAQAYAAAGGQSVAPGFVYQGLMAPAGAQYSLHGMQLTEVAQVYQIEREAAAKVQPAPQQLSLPLVQMPAGTPPVTQAIANAYNTFLPPGAPESMPQLAQAQTAPPAQAAPAEAPTAEKPKSKRGRPKNDSGPAPEPVAAVTQGSPPSSPPAPATQAAPAAAPTTPPAGLDSGLALQIRADDAACVLVNARFAGKATRSLASYVDYVNSELAKRYCVTADGKPCPQDVRCAPKDSVLAFGAWKGAVREVVKADPPPADLYHLDTFMDELNEVVADALRVVAEQRGWMYVRSVR